jgi:DNA helicase HerA-like ATPase
MANLHQDGKILVGKGDEPKYLTVAFGHRHRHRHGIVSGLPGTGKTVTLPTLAQGVSRVCVPVFAADARKALLGKIEHMAIEHLARVIRSKGVGVYVVSQNPLDVPDKAPAQRVDCIRHALRAFAPRRQKAVKAAAGASGGLGGGRR